MFYKNNIIYLSSNIQTFFLKHFLVIKQNQEPSLQIYIITMVWKEKESTFFKKNNWLIRCHFYLIFVSCVLNILGSRAKEERVLE